MAFDGITVAALTQELKNTLDGGRISKIAQPESDELLITIKTPQGQRRLYISASASLPLVYLTDENKPSPMTAPNFCMLLRKHIGNARIVGISQPRLERIINIQLEHLDELGDIRQKTLIIEIMGKHSNIIFCDESGRILDSIKHVSAQMSSVREVLPGRDYFIPDTMHKLDPLSADPEAFAEMLRSKPMPISKALYSGFTGISPVVAEEICTISGIDSSMTASDLSDDIMHHLYNQFKIYMDQVREGQFQPVIYYDNGNPKDFSCLPLSHYSAYTKTFFDSASKLLVSYYAEKNLITRIRQKSSDLRRIVQTALERARKKYDLQSRQLRDTEGREKYKIYGELINVYGYNLEPDAKVLEAENYYDNNKLIKIPLDPNKTAQENSQRYFARYNKLKRTYEALSEFIKETQDDILYLESVNNALDIALSEDDLAQIKEELTQSGYIRRKFTKKKVKLKSQPFHYLSSDGYHIYVGKNNFQNEELTFHFANGGDWWFHAKGTLAAYYSKNRGNDKVEIDYIEKKHVKKVNGARPGFVIYHTNYSLVIDSDISGLTLLES